MWEKIRLCDSLVYLLFFKHKPKTDFHYFLLMAISKILKQTSTSMSVSYASKKHVTSGHIVMQTFSFHPSRSIMFWCEYSYSLLLYFLYKTFKNMMFTSSTPPFRNGHVCASASLLGQWGHKCFLSTLQWARSAHRCRISREVKESPCPQEALISPLLWSRFYLISFLQ